MTTPTANAVSKLQKMFQRLGKTLNIFWLQIWEVVWEMVVLYLHKEKGVNEGVWIYDVLKHYDTTL